MGGACPLKLKDPWKSGVFFFNFRPYVGWVCTPFCSEAFALVVAKDLKIANF